MRAVGYIRVSREDENPMNQLHAILTWAKEHGFTVFPFIDYAVSGAVDPFQRQGFKAMLEFMKQEGITTIVVTELERLTRDVEHFEKLKDLKSILGWAVEQDIEIVSIADAKFTELVNQVRKMVKEMRASLPQELTFLKPIYEMVTKILVTVVEMLPDIRISMAQAERERVKERTKRALDRLKAEGRIYTKPTFIHWLALYRSGKRSFSELTKEDVESVKRYFYEQYVKPHLDGVPIMKLYKKFLGIEKPVLDFIRKMKDAEYAARASQGKQVKVRNYYASYTSFYTLIKNYVSKSNTR